MFEGPVTGNIPEVLDNGEVTDGTHVTAGQLGLALTPYAQVTDLAVNTAASGNNAAAIQPLDDRVTAELASKLDSSALAPAIAPLATAAAVATTDGQVAAHGSSIAAKISFKEKARKRELGIFLFFRFRQSAPSSGSAAAAVPERAPEAGAPHHEVEGCTAWRSVSAQHPQLLQVAPVPQRPRVVSVEAVDLVVEGGERLLLDGLHGDLVRAAAQLREGRPALAAFLQHLPVLETPDVGHRLLRHALDLALLLARAVGLDREDAAHLGAQAHVLQDPGGEGLVAKLQACPAGPSPRWPCALRSLSGSL